MGKSTNPNGVLSMIYIAIYLTAIVSANLTLLYFGPWFSIWNALFFIGVDLAIRDKLHEVWKGQNLWPKMLGLICSGSLITILFNLDALQIAIASAVAFGVSALIDSAIFQALIKKHFLVKSNGSNAFGALADSLIFPTLAFGSLMPEIILMQFIAKFIGGGIASIIINKFRN